MLRCSCKWTKLVLNDCEQCSLPGIKRDHTCQIYLCVCAYCFVHYMNFTVEQKTSSDSSIENCCKQCKNIGLIFRQNPKPKEITYSTVCKEIKDSEWVSMQARNWFEWRKKILCCRSRYRCRRYDDDILNLHNRICSLFNGFCRDWTSFQCAYVAQSFTCTPSKRFQSHWKFHNDWLAFLYSLLMPFIQPESTRTYTKRWVLP